MLRLHFTGDDLARVRVATAPDPLWEILLSLHQLPARTGSTVFGRWRVAVRTRLPAQAGMVRHLAPPVGYSPDFLTPPAGTHDLDEGIDAVLATPRRRLRTDLELFAAGRAPAPWTRRLADGDRDTLHLLGRALRSYHDRGLAPYWNHIRARVDSDRAVRARALLDGGYEHLLASLHPAVRWRFPVLEMRYPEHRDLHLGGRGLLLIPSFFCWRMPITVQDPDLPPVLVYPIEHDPYWLTQGPQRSMSTLAALVGGTRATVLEAMADDVTTTGLARRLAISAASASQHATTLREAGLCTTHRDGNTVHHTLTPLGRALLNNQLPGTPFLPPP
jgi:DNA-binding transcriptional ArsR family regulator